MKLIKAILQPQALENVKAGLDAIGVHGITVSDARGAGKQKGYEAEYRGQKYVVNLIPKVKVEIVAKDSDVEKIVKKIIECAKTGQIGDGKIFVTPMDDVIRIRTEERGETAL